METHSLRKRALSRLQERRVREERGERRKRKEEGGGGEGKERIGKKGEGKEGGREEAAGQVRPSRLVEAIGIAHLHKLHIIILLP